MEASTASMVMGDSTTCTLIDGEKKCYGDEIRALKAAIAGIQENVTSLQQDIRDLQNPTSAPTSQPTLSPTSAVDCLTLNWRSDVGSGSGTREWTPGVAHSRGQRSGRSPYDGAIINYEFD